MKTRLLLLAVILLAWSGGVSGVTKSGKKKNSWWKDIVKEGAKKALVKSQDALLKLLQKSKQENVLEKLFSTKSDKEKMLATLKDALKNKGGKNKLEGSVNADGDKGNALATLLDALKKKDKSE